jgi:serine/threonine protein kinase
VLSGKYDSACDLWSIGVITYLCVSGELPFFGRDNKEIFASIKRGNINLKSSAFTKISNECKDLIQKLIEKNTSKRFTCEQALNHAWFKDIEITIETSKLKEMSSNLENHKKQCLLRN